MKKELLPKFMLVTDMLICTLMFFLIVHDDLRWWGPNPFLMSFPILRMWLGFLTYRKSKLASVPIVMMGLMVVFAWVAIPHLHGLESSLFAKPWMNLFLKTAALLDVQVIALNQMQDFANCIYEYRFCFALIGYVWLIGIPLAVFMYRGYKKQLLPTGLGLWKSVGLYAYLFATMFVVAMAMNVGDNIAMGILVLVILLMLIPVIFYRGNFKGLLARNEMVVLATFAMLAVCYVCALGMEEKTVMTVCLFPAMFYALVNWHIYRRTELKNILFIVSASVVFWFAQYMIGLVRVICLLCSLALMAIPVARFAYAIHKRWMSAGLYVMMAFIVPVLSIGYNPYSALEARRVGHFDGYSWAKDGLLVVKGKNGFGLRDRYRMILPAEYDCLEMLEPSKPYCKATKNGMSQIYDIERHELVSDEWFTEVVPCDEYVWQLKSPNGNKFFRMPKIYNRYWDEQLAQILDKLPMKEKAESAF